MKKNIYTALTALLIVAGIAATIHLQAQQQSKDEKPTQSDKSMSDCPLMKKQGMTRMNERGEKGMGFSQSQTTHHFYLTKSGGAIQVEANDPKDTVSRDQIRQHLRHIAMMFTEGNFDIPIFVHDQVPPGVPVMQRLKTKISYRYEETENGGRVRIISSDSEAVAAVQEFLRFQITEHQTGDPLMVGNS